MKYVVKFKPSAAKSLRALNRADQKKIGARINSLADNPRPAGVINLEAKKSLYRVRMGDYRIIYQIKDNILIVLVVAIGHRKDIYNKLQRFKV